MKSFVTLLFASITLILFHTQVKACDLDPTASIEVSPNSDGAFFDGDYIYMDGYSSSANCGYISEYTWFIDNGILGYETVSTHAEYEPDFTLQPTEEYREIDILLQVRNTANNTDNVRFTITIVREHSSYYYLTDHLGSIRVTVDEQGNSIGWDDYYPFGLQMPGRTQNASNPNDGQKFTGYELEQDCETDSSGDCINDVILGLYHAEARLYDPVIGRFMQVDPKADHPKLVGLSPYNYALNNPVYYNDPDGECPPIICGAIAGVALDYALQVGTNLAQGEDLGDALTNIDGKSLLVSGAAGAVGAGIASKSGKVFNLIKGGTKADDVANVADDAAKAVNNPYLKQSGSELKKSKDSFEKLIKRTLNYPRFSDIPIFKVTFFQIVLFLANNGCFEATKRPIYGR